jgi:hypothetical protein
MARNVSREMEQKNKRCPEAYMIKQKLQPNIKNIIGIVQRVVSFN